MKKEKSIFSFLFILFFVFGGFGLGMTRMSVKFANNAYLEGFICPEFSKIFDENGLNKMKCLSLCAEKSSCFGVFYDQVDRHCVGCGDKYLTNKSAVSQIGMKYYQRPTYMIVTEKKSWNQAKVNCQEKGGHLVDIKSKEEQMYIADVFNSFLNIWIGAFRKKEGGPFYWEDGSLINDTFKNWDTDQPNNDLGQQNCVDGKYNIKWKWNDCRCDGSRQSICEYDYNYTFHDMSTHDVLYID